MIGDGDEVFDNVEFWENKTIGGKTKIASIWRTTGAYNQLSDRKFKENLKIKNDYNKKYLKRILDLPVYSYTFKNDNHIQVGCIYDEVETIFNKNCCNIRKTIDDVEWELNNNQKQKMLNYSEIHLYHIIAFQEFYKTKYQPLEQ